MGLSFKADQLSTLGADFSFKKMDVKDASMSMQIWDLGGQESYRETYLSKPEVFNQTAALIFVVDIQDIERLDEAYKYYVREIEENQF